ncbi:MAG: Ig-like domain-containing protein [Clostridia bacterium]|nr:Ig-like domain-containing protein [Clostridia bacterium]
MKRRILSLLLTAAMLTAAFLPAVTAEEWFDEEHEHAYYSYVIAEPTCTEAGEEAFECDCGDSYTEAIPALGHHFHDGVCVRCGAEESVKTAAEPESTPDAAFDETVSVGDAAAGEPCTHANTEQYYGFLDASAVTYEEVSGDDAEHRVVGDYYEWTHCFDCGEDFDYNLIDTWVWEPHDYNSDGSCKKCGHSNACKHENTYIDEDACVEEPVCTPKDSGTHEVYEHYGDLTICQDCGMILSVENDYEYTWTQRHTYDDRNICTECGYESSCAHNGETEVEFELLNHSDDAFTDNGDGTHTYHGDVLVTVYCALCNAVLDESVEPSNGEPEKHHYDPDTGKCYECGAENQCRHDEQYLDKYTYVEGDWVDDGNGRTHTRTGDEYEDVYCENCETLVSRTLIAENVTQTEDHWYEQGSNVCPGCGYVNSCEHRHTNEFTYIDGEYKDNKDNKTHTITGPEYKAVYCEDCGMVVSEQKIRDKATETDEHWYEVGQDTCFLCGHKNTCKHPADKIKDRQYWEEASYTDNGDGTHTIFGTKVILTACTACNANLSEEMKENVSEVEAHFDRGDGCCLCGVVLEGLALKAGKNGTVTLNLGETLRLLPTFANGMTVTGWKSSKPKIAGVSGGLVTAGPNTGSANITVTAVNAKKKKTTATITIKVVDPTIPTKITLNHEKTVTLDIAKGETLATDATIEPATADKDITVKSAKAKIAAVVDGDTVEPRAVGTSKITVTTVKGKKSASFTVKVIDSSIPTGVKITNSELTVAVGETLQLNAEITAETFMVGEKLTWQSAKKKFAAVDENGLVTGVKEGTSRITVTSARNKKAKDTVTVKVFDPKKATKVTVVGPEGETGMVFGTPNEKIQLSAVLEPETAAGGEVTWKSSNSKVVSVDQNGMIECKKMTAKAVVITATARNGGAKGTIKVEVAGE